MLATDHLPQLVEAKMIAQLRDVQMSIPDSPSIVRAGTVHPVHLAGSPPETIPINQTIEGDYQWKQPT